MKHVTMADKSLLIGDEAAELLLTYAALVAKIGGGEEVTVNAIGADGDEVSVGFLLNSGTVLLIESSTGSSLPEPDNHAVVQHMRERLESYRAGGNEPSPFDTLETEA